MEKRPMSAMSDELDDKARAARMKATMQPSVVTEHNGVVYRGKTPVGKSLAHYKRRADELRRAKN